MTPQWQLNDELSATLNDNRRRTHKVPCMVCGRRTEALSGICASHPDGGVTGALYARLRAQCCDISGLTAEQLDEHARNIAGVVAAALDETPAAYGVSSSAAGPDVVLETGHPSGPAVLKKGKP